MASQGNRLAQLIRPMVEPIGFKYARNRFVRRTHYGFDEFVWTSHPTVSPSGLAECKSLVFGLRHDVVEDVVNGLGLVYGEANQRATTTVFRPLVFFPPMSGVAGTFVVKHGATDSDLSAAATGIVDAVKAEGLPFYARYASLSECAEGLNTDLNAEPHHLFNNFEGRAYNAIAAASLSAWGDIASLVDGWRRACDTFLPQSRRLQVHTNVDKLLTLLSNVEVRPNPSLERP